MRDAHRMKEKLELSLDNRQVASVLIGGLVVLGAVFVLGVVVGKKLSGTQAVHGAPDILTALDRQARAMDEVRAEPQLTFQEELTRKVTVETPRADAPPVKVVTLAAPEPKPEAAPEPEPEKIEEPAPEGDVQLANAEAPKPETKVALDEQVEPAAVTARTASNDSELKKAIARTAVKPTVIEVGSYTLQLSATQTRSEADKFVEKLRTRGYSPYVVEADVPGKGTWFRVRMGRFPTRDAAGRYLQDFRRETRLDAFVASVN